MTGRAYPDFDPLPTTGVRRTEAGWDAYYTDLERRKIAIEREREAMRARWQANSDEYFRRRDQASEARS